MKAPSDTQLAELFKFAVAGGLFKADVDLIRVRAFNVLVRHRPEDETLLCIECGKLFPCPTAEDLTTGELR